MSRVLYTGNVSGRHFIIPAFSLFAESSYIRFANIKFMARHNQLGKTGEERAAEYLISKGYVIRDVNWRSGKMELDIVACRDNLLVVVEVKTRKNIEYLRPEEAVTLRKMNHIVRATDAYIRIYDIHLDTRFDIITLVGEGDNFEIEHIVDAFFPPLNSR